MIHKEHCFSKPISTLQQHTTPITLFLIFKVNPFHAPPQHPIMLITKGQVTEVSSIITQSDFCINLAKSWTS